ncbi:MAG TPA: hypothetical protein VF342_17520 [Alphaproteobacteria bacterium]
MTFVLTPKGPVEEAIKAGALFWIICRSCEAIGMMDVRQASAGKTHTDMAALAADLARAAKCHRCGGTDCYLDYRGPACERRWVGPPPAPAARPIDGETRIIPAECWGPRDADIDVYKGIALISAFFESFRPPHVSRPRPSAVPPSSGAE